MTCVYKDVHTTAFTEEDLFCIVIIIIIYCLFCELQEHPKSFAILSFIHSGYFYISPPRVQYTT